MSPEKLCPECGLPGHFRNRQVPRLMKKTGLIKRYTYQREICGHCEYLKRKEREFKKILE
jgi:hypothetical protein